MAFITFQVSGVDNLSPFSTNYGGSEVVIRPGTHEIDDDAATYLESLTPAEWPPRINLTFSFDEAPPPAPAVAESLTDVPPPPGSDPPPPPANTGDIDNYDSIPDIENMNADDAIAAIQAISDHDVLGLLLELEQAGKKRKTVIKELEDLLS